MVVWERNNPGWSRFIFWFWYFESHSLSVAWKIASLSIIGQHRIYSLTFRSDMSNSDKSSGELIVKSSHFGNASSQTFGKNKNSNTNWCCRTWWDQFAIWSQHLIHLESNPQPLKRGDQTKKTLILIQTDFRVRLFSWRSLPSRSYGARFNRSKKRPSLVTHNQSVYCHWGDDDLTWSVPQPHWK